MGCLDRLCTLTRLPITEHEPVIILQFHPERPETWSTAGLLRATYAHFQEGAARPWAFYGEGHHDGYGGVVLEDDSEWRQEAGARYFFVKREALREFIHGLKEADDVKLDFGNPDHELLAFLELCHLSGVQVAQTEHLGRQFTSHELLDLCERREKITNRFLKRQRKELDSHAPI